MTGYDMEDAMIINKASFERGFGHASVYKTHMYDLDEEEKRCSKDGVRPNFKFSNVKAMVMEGDVERPVLHREHLDVDGLPCEGQQVVYGQTICCIVDMLTGEVVELKHKDAEAAFVDTVRVIGTGSVTASSSDKAIKKAALRKVSITLRYRRNPIIGDKFSSRHGQKGTLSVLWPQESMPFTESGMTPDVLINPHAFPSRMTIGMLIESMAGKAGAMHGAFQDSTPFQFNEERRAIDHYGEQLRLASNICLFGNLSNYDYVDRASGYHYYGSEPLYNGLTGNIMHADIFIGVVFYQRLRHMVADKAQVRSTGPIVSMTRQPVKGRKRGGGIRLGEMERDALISHGVAFCLQDRLMHCSDSHLAFVCGTCGSLLTVCPRSHAGLRNASGMYIRRPTLNMSLLNRYSLQFVFI